MNSQVTKFAFSMGVVYFFCMAVAHFFSIKLPILFIYYDVPFYAYQDKIISFAVCSYIALFYLATKNRENAKAAITVLGITILGLCFVNSSEELISLLDGKSTLIYWLQTGAIFLYFLVLIVLYSKDSKKQTQYLR